MVGTLALVSGIVFLIYAARQLSLAGEPSWLAVVILPGGLMLTLIGVLGVLIPGYL